MADSAGATDLESQSTAIATTASTPHPEVWATEGASGDEREIRAARNESMFRSINDRLTRVDLVAEITGGHMIACECADLMCVQTLAISIAQYQEVRGEPRRFAVLPGHVYPVVENVITESGAYVVVEKIGAGG